MDMGSLWTFNGEAKALFPVLKRKTVVFVPYPATDITFGYTYIPEKEGKNVISKPSKKTQVSPRRPCFSYSPIAMAKDRQGLNCQKRRVVPLV